MRAYAEGPVFRGLQSPLGWWLEHCCCLQFSFVYKLMRDLPRGGETLLENDLRVVAEAARRSWAAQLEL